jgi:hypothetical protein
MPLKASKWPNDKPKKSRGASKSSLCGEEGVEVLEGM